MKWEELYRPELTRISDGGRYILRKCISPNGALIGYSLWRVEYIDLYPTPEAATKAIMTRSGQMAGR